MIRLLRECLFGLFWLLSHFMQGFSQDISFQRLPFSFSGSSQPVTGMTQDQQGYMWFSGAGLIKFDGYKTVRYLNNPLNKNSIISNFVETVYSDREGMIWIGTPSGLDKFDPKTNSFTHFLSRSNDSHSLVNNSVTSILEDREANLWVGTQQGLCVLNTRSGQFTQFLHNELNPGTISNDDIRVIYEDRQAVIWVGCGDATDHSRSGSSGGLNRYDRKTGKFIRYMHDPRDPQSLFDNHIRSILEDSHGNFWVGSEGSVLHSMDRETGKFIRYAHDLDTLKKWSNRKIRFSPLGNDHITFLIEDKMGKVWIGTLLSGLDRLDPASGKIEHFYQEQREGGFADSWTWWGFASREGVIWISTFQYNLYKTDAFERNAPYHDVGSNIFGMMEDKENNLWIGTRKGLQVMNADENKNILRAVNQILALKGVSIGFAQAFCEDQNHIIWIGTGLRELFGFNLATHEFKHFTHDPKDTTSFNGGAVFKVCPDQFGNLWVATDLGLEFLNMNTGKFSHFVHLATDSTSLAENYCQTIFMDRQNRLWIGSINGGGVSRMDPTTGKFERFLAATNVYEIFQDAEGVIWLGADDGVHRSKDFKTFTQFHLTDDEFEDETASAILEDKDKNLWMQVRRGIYKINPERNEIYRFGRNQGLNFNGAGTGIFIPNEGEAGELLFAGETGYYSFYPESLKTNPFGPEIQVRNFRPLSQEAKKSNILPLGSYLDTANEVRLNHDQNAFSFDLAAIHYTAPEGNRLQYMVGNYDKEWRPGRPGEAVYYYNVPPGQYKLRVKASSSDGVWSERNYSIMISPPWWQTWWAFSLYGLLALLAFFRIHRYQKARYVRMEREKSRVKELEHAKEIQKAYDELRTMQNQLIQQEKMASLGELTAGIAHEIQNPLNFVNNFSEVNTELIAEMNEQLDKSNLISAKSIAGEIAKNEQKIVDHGRRADSIVKGMLQHSRISGGLKEETNINELADEYLKLAYHGMRAKDKDFNATLQTDFDKSIRSLKIVSQDIMRVLLNMYNNAFYAVTEKKKLNIPGYEPTVSVSTKKAANKVEIRIKDNGQGIPEKIKDKIFQPFFTTKPAGQGTGLGLSLSYDIVKAQGGEIKVETKEGEGSEFIILLPI